MASEIIKIGVVGLGTMGAGIAEVFARQGFDVTAVDANEAAVAAGRGHIETSLGRALSRGKITEADRDSTMSRIRFATSVEDLADRELVIEAVPEDLELKRSIFRQLDSICPPEAILASNTSSLSVTEIAVATGRPDRVVGMHFFNPAPVLKFVEVVRTVVSSPEVLEEVAAVAKRLDKLPVVVGDRAGFIANALLFGYLNHAMSMFEAKYATREDIDAAMRFGGGYPLGPLQLLDLIGLDTSYEILDTMYKQGRDRLHAPAPILKQLVTAGMRGRKTGRGFYTYQGPHSPVVVDDALTPRVSEAATSTRAIASVGVVGSGTMASGIAEVFAKGGLPTIVVARSETSANKVRAAVEKSLEKALIRGKLSETERDEALARVSVGTDYEALASVDLVVEAVVEELSVKVALFETLDEICKPGAILATTTSSLPVIELASATNRAADVVGLHFFNPAAVMKLVEVVATVATSDEVVATAVALCTDLGKHPVVCGDRAGFIMNALLFPYLNDAVRMLEQNYATAEDIDVAMKTGCGLPMGPFELLDVVGLDVSLAIQQTLYREFREPGYAPAPRLEQLVTAGYLGKKTGRGFRTYE